VVLQPGDLAKGVPKGILMGPRPSSGAEHSRAKKGVAGVQDKERAWVGPGRLARGMVGGALVRAPESGWRWRTIEGASVRRARVAGRARPSTRNAAPQGHLRADRSKPLNPIFLGPAAGKNSQRSDESGGHEVPELVNAEWLPTDLPPEGQKHAQLTVMSGRRYEWWSPIGQRARCQQDISRLHSF